MTSSSSVLTSKVQSKFHAGCSVLSSTGVLFFFLVCGIFTLQYASELPLISPAAMYCASATGECEKETTGDSGVEHRDGGTDQIKDNIKSKQKTKSSQSVEEDSNTDTDTYYYPQGEKQNYKKK
jgi:hypothetical protein